MLTRNGTKIIEGVKGTAVAGDIRTGKSAYINGVKVTGTIAKNGSYNYAINIYGSILDVNYLAYAYEITEIIITGDLENLPSDATMLYLANYGGAVTGGITDIPASVTYIKITVNDIITGSLANLPVGLTYLDVRCSLLTGAYNANASINYIFVDGTNMSADDTDQTLINLNANTATTGTITVKANRTTASDAAVTALVGKGWTVTEGD